MDHHPFQIHVDLGRSLRLSKEPPAFVIGEIDKKIAAHSVAWGLQAPTGHGGHSSEADDLKDLGNPLRHPGAAVSILVEICVSLADKAALPSQQAEEHYHKPPRKRYRPRWHHEVDATQGDRHLDGNERAAWWRRCVRNFNEERPGSTRSG